MSADEVPRETQPVYLAVTLLLKQLNRSQFFQPILDKCHSILDRWIRAKVPQYVAEIVVEQKSVLL